MSNSQTVGSFWLILSLCAIILKSSQVQIQIQSLHSSCPTFSGWRAPLTGHSAWAQKQKPNLLRLSPAISKRGCALQELHGSPVQKTNLHGSLSAMLHITYIHIIILIYIICFYMFLSAVCKKGVWGRGSLVQFAALNRMLIRQCQSESRARSACWSSIIKRWSSMVKLRARVQTGTQ